MATGERVTDVQKQMAQMCHMSALIGVVAVGLAMPLGPLLVWMAKRDMGPFVDAHGKEALNFQLTYWVPTGLLALLGFVNAWFLMLPLVIVMYAGVMAILAGMKAVEGQMYQYPGTVRLIR